MLKPNPPMAMEAWLSPEGDLYSTHHGGHLDLADKIVNEVLGISLTSRSRWQAEAHLEDTGWVKVRSHGYWWRQCGDVSQAQLNTLGELAMLGGEFGRRVQEALTECQ